MFTDCITYADIPDENLIVLYEGKTTYYFDIETLYQHYKSSGNMENPYTRVVLDDSVKTKVEKYGDKDVVAVDVNYGGEDLYFDRNTTFGELILTILDVGVLKSDLLICSDKGIMPLSEQYKLSDPIRKLKKKRIQCITTTPNSNTNLRKLLEWLKTNEENNNLTYLIDNELRFGQSVKV